MRLTKAQEVRATNELLVGAMKDALDAMGKEQGYFCDTCLHKIDTYGRTGQKDHTTITLNKWIASSICKHAIAKGFATDDPWPDARQFFFVEHARQSSNIYCNKPSSSK